MYKFFFKRKQEQDAVLPDLPHLCAQAPKGQASGMGAQFRRPGARHPAHTRRVLHLSTRKRRKSKRRCTRAPLSPKAWRVLA